MAFVFAIDPGKTGRIAVFDSGGLESIWLANPYDLASLLDARPSACVVIEQVNGVPGQSGPASFNFGKSYGELLGVCVPLDVEPVLIRPVEWKAALGLRREFGETTAKFKGRSLAMAREIWPNHAKTFFARARDDGAAEAALLGHYVISQGIV